MLKVSPWKGVVRFAKKGKLTTRYMGPFEIIERIGPVAYRLSLPDELSGVHDVFHVLNLKKCLADETLIIPVEEIQLDEHLRFVEEPLEIMDHKVKKLRRSRIPIVKVRWNSRREPEFTWEREDHMKNKYPQLFAEEVVFNPLVRPHTSDRLKTLIPASCTLSRFDLHASTPGNELGLSDAMTLKMVSYGLPQWVGRTL
ncbi:hypothetical protein E3N88_00833 [Mikania micrantha]|uniref:Tf2-1-like SH3-like domain-containing protein n=1 Tax=Mikania micrantha TaxID=192012 RepID=A0A5N6Q0N6_9ASTR|nr:hypothetical protein E3N88_00833 [Mikania micrantha]